MTEWTIGEEWAVAICQGCNIEVRWGNAQDYTRILKGKGRAPQEGARPDDADQGLLVQVKSEHRGIDITQMLVVEKPNDPQEVIRNFTGENPPESLLPEFKDWMKEWEWITQYHGRARWKTRNKQATAIIGHLIITSQLTTMGEARRQLGQTMEPDTPYGSNENIQQEIPDVPDRTPVILTEVREDLRSLVSRVTRTKDEKVNTIRQYARKNDPAIVLMTCITEIYQNDPEHIFRATG